MGRTFRMAQIGSLGVLLIGGRGDSSPSLDLRVSPKTVMVGGVQHLTIELKGAPTEEWYCPEVEWVWPGGTHSKEEGDCPSWEEAQRESPPYFPRVWTKSVRFSPGGKYTIEVILSKGGRVIGRRSVEAIVLGGLG